MSFFARCDELYHRLATLKQDSTSGGLDREEAKKAFNEFLNGQIYSPNQIEFVNMIIDYLTKNGVMDANLLYKPPYTDYNSNGLSGVFADDEASKIVRILSSIKHNAAA